MNINQHIEIAYPHLIRMVTAIVKDNITAVDLVHDSIADFLSMNEEKQHKIKDDDRVKEYIYQIAKTQYFSSNSTFHLTYRENQLLKVKEETVLDDLQLEELDTHNINELRLIMVSINKTCNKFEKQLISDRFIENMTYKEIALKHDLPTYLVTNKIKKIIQKLQHDIF